MVGEGAVVHAGAKLWPGKEVDPGAMVKTSIIWGSQGRRVLFGRYGVTGVVNVDLDAGVRRAAGRGLRRHPAARLGGDHQPRWPRRLAHAQAGGDLRPALGRHPRARPANRADPRGALLHPRDTSAASGVHVRISPFDQRVVDIRFFDSEGMNLDKHEERNVERVFFREDFRRAYMDGIGTISYAADAIPLYNQAFLKSVDQEAIRSAGFNIVVDYAFATTSQVLSDILQALQVSTTPLGARVDPAYISLEQDVFDRMSCAAWRSSSRLWAAISACAWTWAVRRSSWPTTAGRLVPDALACAAMVELALRSKPGGVVAVPVNLSSIFERIARAASRQHPAHPGRCRLADAGRPQRRCTDGGRRRRRLRLPGFPARWPMA